MELAFIQHSDIDLTTSARRSPTTPASIPTTPASSPTTPASSPASSRSLPGDLHQEVQPQQEVHPPRQGESFKGRSNPFYTGLSKISLEHIFPRKGLCVCATCKNRFLPKHQSAFVCLHVLASVRPIGSFAKTP